MEKYLKWKNKELKVGGTVRFVLEGDMFSFQKVSGSSIPTRALIELLWNSVALADFRSAAADCKRSGNWSLGHRYGMSGCTDWYIRYLTKEGTIKCTKDIIHSSMNDKQNYDITGIWIRDLYDCLWAMQKYGLYLSSFINDDNTPYNYKDITDDVLRTRNAFLKDSYSGFNQGFGEYFSAKIIDDAKIYE
jgi:hypothetical protein